MMKNQNSMKNQKSVLIVFILIILITSFFTGCSVSINGTIAHNGNTDLYLSSSLGSKTVALLRSFDGGKSSKTDSPIIDAALLNEGLKKVKSVTRCNLKNSPGMINNIEGNISISNINEFLQQEKKSNGIKVTLSKANAPQFLESLSPDLNDYLSAIMAPVATGEDISRTEYLELVASVYGDGVAKEIKNARLKIKLNSTVFDIALLDILVLEKNLVYEIEF
ncbi:MAG: hypothetical protein Ta2G_01000 [Termitinemataceae bacterium]|nr:MAG: hypothetical protein Ta2G_01000 [Termitinemataceae bacterium]